MRPTTAQRRRAEGKCYQCESLPAVGHTHCARHLEAMRLRHYYRNTDRLLPRDACAAMHDYRAAMQAVRTSLASQEAVLMPRWPHTLPTDPGPTVGCCGAWHAITALPMTMPCCGRLRFVRRAVEAATAPQVWWVLDPHRPHPLLV